jgi:hypothetical protein
MQFSISAAVLLLVAAVSALPTPLPVSEAEALGEFAHVAGFEGSGAVRNSLFLLYFPMT